MNSTPNQTANPGESRRTFIKKAATAAAVVSTANLFKTPVYGQSQAPAPGRVLGANDRINVAYIGTGKQGMMHITIEKKYAQDNNTPRWRCDVYQRHPKARTDRRVRAAPIKNHASRERGY